MEPFKRNMLSMYIKASSCWIKIAGILGKDIVYNAIWRKFYVKMLSKLKIVYRNYLQCSNSGSKLCTLDCYQQSN